MSLPLAKLALRPEARTNRDAAPTGKRAPRRLPWAPLLVFPILLGSLFTSGLGRADVDKCETLGVALTEHSCFHSEFGPFDTVEASPGTSPSASTPNIDSVHTEFRVVLADPDGLNVVTYSPVRSGQWVVFTASYIPLIIEDGAGEPLPLLRSDEGTTGCDALPIARTFELTADEQYRFLLGPHDVREAILVVEYADDFLVAHSRDRDGDGYGDPGETIEASACSPEDGWAAKTGDCDDADPDIHPGARETCDDIDRNCNGITDDVGLHCRSGLGACVATGVFACDDQDGSLARCDAVEGAPAEETCNGVDDNCDGLIDENADNLCDESDAPTCARHEMGRFCGCLVDADCGSLSSGRICDAESGTCRDGCRPVAPGNGCPSDQECKEAEEMPAACTDRSPADPDDDPPDPAEDTDTEEPTSEETNSEGCSCQLSGPRGGQGRATMGLGFLILALLIRRRRRPIALAALGIGCGGQVSTHVDGTGGSGSDSPEPQCELVLAEDPIDHACSHSSHGPFESVVASRLEEAKAPAVDEVHVPYTVDLAAGEEGWVSYHARRDGEHVVFLGSINIALRAEHLEDAAWAELDSAQLKLSQACPALEHGYLFEFQSGETYRIIIRRTEQEPTNAPIDLFVEHLGTFSGSSISEECQ